jgi:hypothetical protein
MLSSCQRRRRHHQEQEGPGADIIKRPAGPG